jgi:phosphate transport system substrate-binding protein
VKTTRIMLLATAGSLAAFAAQARDQIQIVGSSTVFPFTTAVAEEFGRTSGMPTPVVESTGTGGGMKLFCGGVGESTPDLTNASRRIKASEFELCKTNGVTEIIESSVGFDGIAVANAKDGPVFDITLATLCKALVVGAGEPATWDEIDPSLPAIKIEVLGPPPSSGTRDSFEELALAKGCEEAGVAVEEIAIRQDGVWVDSGENDNLIVSKLGANPNAIGVFGYSFLEENTDTLKSAVIDGFEADYDTISSGDYPLSRTMYIYAKKAHIGLVPGIAEFLAAYTSPEVSGEDGFLTDKGLIALPPDVFAANADAVANGVVITGEGLH